MGRRTAILFIAPDAGLTFVADDVEILSRRWRLDVLERREYPSNRRWLPVVVGRLARRRYALLYVWFADPYDVHWLLPTARLFGARSAIVTGGYDVAALPEIGYGVLSDRRDRRRVGAALARADAVLPFSRFSAGEVRRLAPDAELTVVYPGVECSYFHPDGAREPLVITVATVSATTWRRKGLDVFARCARLLPGLRFAIVGRVDDQGVAAELRALGGDRLVLAGRVGREELRRWYRRAAVYAQLSAHEGFGLALAEAMACGCAPVVAERGSLPEVVGDCGRVVPYGDERAAAGAMAEALESDLGDRARRRVAASFPIERRRRELVDLVSHLTAGAG